jgi:hypothetical protein
MLRIGVIILRKALINTIDENELSLSGIALRSLEMICMKVI